MNLLHLNRQIKSKDAEINNLQKIDPNESNHDAEIIQLKSEIEQLKDQNQTLENSYVHLVPS